MAVYLIDFENVHETGLKGIDSLAPKDAIHLFYTVNAGKISLDLFEECKKHELILHKVPAGKQSLDMLLVSYLGYLYAACSETEFVVVSKDKDFAHAIEFWNERTPGKSVRQQNTIGSENRSRVAAIPPQSAVEAAPVQAETPAEAPADADFADTVEEIPPEEPEFVPGPPEEAVAEAEAAPAEEQTEELAWDTAEAPDAPQPDAPMEEVRPQSSRPRRGRRSGENRPRESRAETVSVNNTVQKLLSAEGVDTARISFIASLAAKNYGKPNFRQTVYRAILKQYGQKEGLALYGIIKSCL